LKTGIYKSVTNEQYHADPAISSTKLKKLANSTAYHFKYALENPQTMEGDSILLGSLVHTLVGEPKKLTDQYIIESQPLSDKTKLEKNGGSKGEWDAMKKQSQDQGLPLVKHEIYRNGIAMRNSVFAHPLWQVMADRQKAEISLFAEIEGIPVKARYDLLIGDTIIDLKSTRESLDNENLSRVIAKLGYHFSAAMYIEVGKALSLPMKKFRWIFVENTAPFACRFVEASEEMLETGKQEFYACLEVYKSCKNSNNWPGYTQNIEQLSLPVWYKNKEFFLGENNESDNQDDGETNEI